MNSDQPITSREFTREFTHVKESLGRIEDHLERLNSKTATHGEAIQVLKRDVGALIDEDAEIDKKVDQLSREGCAHYATHTEMLRELAGVSAWSGRRKAAVAGTLVGTGMLAWPTVKAFLEAVQQVIERVPIR